jgi:DUF4097 and DUF4098 domain-containing protein YvlB
VGGFRGSITATATRGDAVEMVIHETVTGRTKEEIAEARQKIKLDLTQEGNRVRAYVDGPFRCREGSHRWHGEDRVSERVAYHFELRVPAETAIDLRTVTGDVKVDGTDGRFKVASVNGKVEMGAVRGSGSARSVNGPVKVSFAANPGGTCSFETVNGELDVAFRSGLDADLRFKTLNGEVFTDYPYVRRSLATPAGDRKNGRFLLQRSGTFGITIGGGGRELAFATINGDILVRNQDH